MKQELSIENKNLSWRIEAGVSEIAYRGEACMRSEYPLLAATPHGLIPLPCLGSRTDGDGRQHLVYGNDMVEVLVGAASGEDDAEDLALYCTVRNLTEELCELSVRMDWEVVDSGVPDWLVPAMFYKHNRFPETVVPYPGYDIDNRDPENGWSDHWSFRSDRTALPAVFCRMSERTVALCTVESVADGVTGVSFLGNRNHTKIGLDFPFREEPGTYMSNDLTVPKGKLGQVFAPPKQTYMTLAPGASEVFPVWIYAASSDAHAYAPFVRRMNERFRTTNLPNPWMGPRQAAELTSYGLYKWHYQPDEQVLYETIAFDREANMNAASGIDRKHMHVGWISGTPHAFALLRQGVTAGIPEYVEAAGRVISNIAGNLAPCGTFWGQWTKEAGWNAGWNPDPQWVQANTLGESVLFMLRAYEFELEQGREHKDWAAAVRSNLDFALRVQREDGNFGSYYHVNTGEVTEWRGAVGLLWISALCLAAKLFGETRYRDAALKAGHYYESFIRDEFIYGAPEDCHLLPNSEDGYNAIMAYIALYETDGDRVEWLELARLAADWTLTFRWTYNIKWPKHTMLEKYDFRSRGADNASPSNNHLHSYGLVCFPEMRRLSEHTGDNYYFDRNREHVACFLQFIAREDGDFNAYKGMVTERYYNTSYIQPKGMILTLSHAWCLGLQLYAYQEVLKEEQLFGFEDGFLD